MQCFVQLLVALVACTTVAVSTNCTVHKCIKNTNYTGIEQSLIGSDENLVNLRQAFFPTNRQPSISVQVTYQFRGEPKETALYRWLDSPVNLLIHSDLLFWLSLTIYKVETRHVTLYLDPIEGFENEEVNSTTPDRICQPDNLTAHHLLNNLTVNLLSYALHRSHVERIDLNTETGYSAYVFDSGPGDFCIFDEVTPFLNLRIILWFSFLALALTVAIAAPLLMVGVYTGFKKKMEGDESRLRYFVWAFIGTSTVLVILMYVCNGMAIGSGLDGSPPTKFSDVVMSYEALIGLLVGFPILDVLGAIIIMYVFSRIQHVRVRDRERPREERSKWIDCYYKNCLCRKDYRERFRERSKWIDCYYINCLCRKDYHQVDDAEEDDDITVDWSIENFGVNRCCKCYLKNFLHLYSIVFVTMFIQLVIFNSIFLSLAVVAAPIEAGSVLILYLTSIFTLISFIALVLKIVHTLQTRLGCLFYLIFGILAFILLIAGVGLFAWFMYLYTILVQEYRNSRGVIAFIGPILPSVLASAVGGVLIKIFSCIKNPETTRDESNPPGN